MLRYIPQQLAICMAHRPEVDGYIGENASAVRGASKGSGDKHSI
jgi:hypothetical protein